MLSLQCLDRWLLNHPSNQQDETADNYYRMNAASILLQLLQLPIMGSWICQHNIAHKVILWTASPWGSLALSFWLNASLSFPRFDILLIIHKPSRNTDPIYVYFITFTCYKSVTPASPREQGHDMRQNHVCSTIRKHLYSKIEYTCIFPVCSQLSLWTKSICNTTEARSKHNFVVVDLLLFLLLLCNHATDRAQVNKITEKWKVGLENKTTINS